MAKKIDISVSSLVDMVQQGDLRLPSIQRRYVWPVTRVRDLMDSLYRGYPSGSILVWETDKDVPEREFAVEQDDRTFRAYKLLLDGQQRLTSLSAITRGVPLKLKRVRPVEIAFNLDHPEGAPSEATEVEGDAASEDDDEDGEDEVSVQERVRGLAFVVANRFLLKDPHWIPVSRIFDTTVTDWHLLKPLNLTPDQPEWEKYTKRLQRVRAIRDYPYVMHVLERDLSYEEVTEIFVRVNSLGMKLRSSDLALALITSRWPAAVQLFEDFLEHCEKVWFTFDLGMIVRTLVVFATRQSRFRTVGRIPIKRLQDSWQDAKRGLDFAVNFLRSNAGIEDESLLSSPLLVVPVAVFAVLRQMRLSRADERALLHWLFTANALGHYSGATETTLDKDLGVLFAGGGPDELTALLQQQHGRLRFEASDFAGRSARNPLFQTTYLALRHAGAKDWWTGLGISLTHQGRFHFVQEHHIFPKSLLAKKEYERREINEIANLAFVGGGANRSIGNKPPSVYFPAIVAKRGADALTSQCVPLSGELWEIDRYREFLAYRRTALATTVNEFLDSVSTQPEEAVDIEGLLASGEGDRAEFKESARVNRHTAGEDRTLRLSLAKAVAGLMNADGGSVVVGVSDNGDVVGIEHDVVGLDGRKPEDAYEQFLRSTLGAVLGKVPTSELRISFHQMDELTVCLLQVPRATQAVYVGADGTQKLFVRSGNTTRSFGLPEAEQYLKRRFS
ncbi:MAG: DUF262 domain-containing protein [Chloroflexi bacterium]|nr:DUF262 domain-containing protein [Chloroflexota bacterium]